jgi:acyl-CoA reductase-like NAD-dependent aldehyde dehydrogenase
MTFTLTIDGNSTATVDHFTVRNPADETLIGECPIASADLLDAAVAAARRAFPGWAATDDTVRKNACHAVAAAIETHAEELANLLSREQGKPLNGIGARFELGGCAGWAHYTAELDLPVEVLQDNAEGRVELHRKPIGVVGSITPWNWPLLIAIWHIMPAIRTGNTVVLKPSPYTSLSTLRMVEIIAAVLPPGVLNVVAGTDDLGQWMSEHPGIDKISCTGSTATGQRILASIAPTLKRVTLELGGNDAGIVLADADPAAIAEGLFWGAFINNGQTCAALKRLYVHDDIYDDVCASLAAFTATIPVGHGLDEGNLLGPVQNAMQHAKICRLVDEAKAAGARILTGGEAPEGPGYFYPVTLIADATDDMAIVTEEQFGPALPILRYTDLDDAIARANASDAGLGGSVWSSDPVAARAVASQLEAGSVWVNSHGMIQPNIPFGGVKKSGMGVMFGHDGLKELTTVQCLFTPPVG